MDFYVYIWTRSTDTSGWPAGSPYYIGKGCGDRAFIKADHRLKVPKDASFIQIIPCRDEESAFETERFFISYYGRKDLGTGCLRNLTAGGDGITSEGISPETRLKMRIAKLGKPLLKTRGHENYQVATHEQLSEWGKLGSAAVLSKMSGSERAKGLIKHSLSLTPEEIKARATIASHSIPVEQRKENGRIGQIKSNHNRHHVKRGIVSPTCELCK